MYVDYELPTNHRATCLQPTTYMQYQKDEHSPPGSPGTFACKKKLGASHCPPCRKADLRGIRGGTSSSLLPLSLHTQQYREIWVVCGPLGKDTWTPPWPPIWFHTPTSCAGEFDDTDLDYQIPPRVMRFMACQSGDAGGFQVIQSFGKFWWVSHATGFDACLLSWKRFHSICFGFLLTVETVDWACKAYVKCGFTGFGVH